MKKIINKVISKMKNEEYEIDKNIPSTYLICLIYAKIVQLLRGFFVKFHFKKLFKGKKIFIGKHVTIKAKKLIKCGKCVTIGDYSYIDALSKNGITIGNNVSFGRNTIIECTGVIRELGEGLIIEDGVGIAANSFIAVRGNVIIGKDTIIGPNFKLHAENHVFSDINIPIRLQGATRKGVTIGEDCWIGSNVTILDGVHVGKKCIIAAGAVVNKDIPDFSIIGGVPAKIIKSRKDDSK